MIIFARIILFFLLLCMHVCMGHTGLAAVDRSHVKLRSDTQTIKPVNKTAILDEACVMPNITSRKIRVLLEEIDLEKESIQKNNKIVLKSPNGFVLESPSGSGNTALFQNKELCISHKNNELYLRCKDQKYRKIKSNNLEICNSSQCLNVDKSNYQGSITTILDNDRNRLLIINTLDLEDYVYSVLGSEAISSWPMNMLKIQAIASRTFAVFSMQQAGKKNKSLFYDIKNTNYDQIYKGLHKSQHLRTAVNETRGIILKYKDNVALTMFDICCGGVVPGHLRYRDNSKPYLCRTQRCTHCSNATFYRWKEDVHHNTFLAQLKKNPKLATKLKNFGDKLTDIQIIDKDKAGLVHKIKLIGPRKHVILAGKELKPAFKNGMKSNAFSIKKTKDRIVTVGNGYGHHTGLCQWGAKALVDNGWHYKKILNFYYPNTKLSTLA